MGWQVVHDASGAVEALVFNRASLGVGDRFAGPSIVTQFDATTLVAPGWQAEVLARGRIVAVAALTHTQLLF